MHAYRIFRASHLLSQELREFLATDAGNDFKSLVELFPAAWKVVVMGGLLRDMLLRTILGVEMRPADVDMVVFGARSIDEIKSKLGSVIQSTNAFGGVKCQLRAGGMVFDLWRIEDHTNMSEEPQPHDLEQLLRHNLLDVDAILWSPASDELHDCGCLGAIENRRIGMMGSEGISEKFLASQVAHVLVIAFKTGFSLAENARSFVASASAQCRPGEIERIVARKLPRDAAQIEAFWNDILSGGTQACPAPTRTASL
jgi:hypothetical protein